MSFFIIAFSLTFIVLYLHKYAKGDKHSIGIFSVVETVYVFFAIITQLEEVPCINRRNRLSSSFPFWLCHTIYNRNLFSGFQAYCFHLVHFRHVTSRNHSSRPTKKQINYCYCRIRKLVNQL